VRALAVLATLALTANASAADARWYTQIDNDVAWGTDRWYTSGVRIAREKDGAEWGVQQEIYTPDAKRWVPGRADRAPVGRLFATYARHERTEGIFQTLEVDLGVRGPAAAGRDAAEQIHHLVPAPQVDWSRQLGNRFDGQAVFVRTQQFLTRQLKLHWGGVLGSQVAFAHVGAEFRVGANASVASPLLRFAATPPFDAGETGWSVFWGASVRGVARNRLLERNYDPFGPALSRERAVVRGTAGLTWTGSWGAFEFSLVGDSREFEGQHAPHRFGSLSLHVPF
jgi:lipid A 3-O-deacylase